jgi:hypothetical protein
MATYVPYRKLKANDRRRITSKSIYPHRTKGQGVDKYLYPVNRDGDLVNKSRRHV